MPSPLNALLNYIDNAKRTAKNNLLMWAEDPQMAAENTAAGIQEQIDAFRADPAGRAGDMVPGGGLAGVIRKGGMPELVAVHQAPLDRFATWAQSRGQLPQELYSPSVAINKGSITQDFGAESGTGGTLHLIARPDALDPARINAQLRNRDMYSPRDRYYKGGRSELMRDAQQDYERYGQTAALPEVKRTFAQDRLIDRYQREDARFRESAATDFLEREHRQSINMSPDFRSFAEFEANPRGAALLGGTPSDIKLASDSARLGFNERLAELVVRGNPVAMRLMQQADSTLEGDATAYILGVKKEGLNSALFKGKGGDAVKALVRDYRKALAYLPSQYGELKVSGPLQIRGNNWAGAIIAPLKGSKIASTDNVNAMAELLRQRGIPSMVNDPAAPLTPQDLGWLARAYSEGVLK